MNLTIRRDRSLLKDCLQVELKTILSLNSVKELDKILDC